MKSLEQGYGYNERLFSGDLRSYFHFARFKWCIDQINKIGASTESVLELGCFDGKLIDFMSEKPSQYIGFDANWEGGLDLAKQKFKDHKNFSFLEANTPQEMILKDDQKFSLAVSMETLEHIPPHLVDGYLKKIADHLDEKGYFLITIPNEKGIIFLLKWLTKKLLIGDTTNYSFSEVINATLGKMELVSRNEHKGFDYEKLIKDVQKYFDIIKISGHPFSFLPPSICFGIGVIAKKKPELN